MAEGRQDDTMAGVRYSLRRRQKRPLVDEHPLDEHLQVQEKSADSESHTCEKCGRHFSHAHHLKKHVQTCAPPKTKARRTLGTFTCKTCGKVFSRSDWLRRHQEVHSKDRPFRCKLCPASYKRRDALQRHELIQHTWPEEQMKKSAASESRCVKCGKVYMAGELTRHMAMAHSTPVQQPLLTKTGSGNISQPDQAQKPGTGMVVNSENVSNSNSERQPGKGVNPENISKSNQAQKPGNMVNSKSISHCSQSEQQETEQYSEDKLSGTVVNSESISHSTTSEQQGTRPGSENKPHTTISGTVEGEEEKVYMVGAILQQNAECNLTQSGTAVNSKSISHSTPSEQQGNEQYSENRPTSTTISDTVEGKVEKVGAILQQMAKSVYGIAERQQMDTDDSGRELLKDGAENVEGEVEKVGEILQQNAQLLSGMAEETDTDNSGSKLVKSGTENEVQTPVNQLQQDADLGSKPVEKNPEEKSHGIVSFICPQCDQLFCKIHLLEAHLLSHLGYTPHLCTVCKTSFRQETDLRSHLEECHQFQDLQKCLYCAQTMPTRFHMNAHVRLLHESRRSWCQQCHKPISPFHTLNAHRKLVHSERKLKCDECGAMFKSMLSLRAHILRHKGTNSCLCDYCGKRFNHKKELQGHVAKVHDPALKRHVCEICGHRTWISADLMDHKYRLHPDQITEEEKQKSSLYRREKNLIRKPAQHYTCEQCGKKYMSMLYLQRHLALHDGTAHTCTVCKQQFLKEADYQRHLKTHEERFSCSVCGKSFASKKKLRTARARNLPRREGVSVHLRSLREDVEISEPVREARGPTLQRRRDPCVSGTRPGFWIRKVPLNFLSTLIVCLGVNIVGETPWHCAVCNTYYEQQVRLTKHAKIHSDETPHLCTHCGKGFKDAAHLQVHENIHTRAKEYACKECGRVFAQYSSMKRHELTHNKSQPHHCPFCDRRFSQKCSMDRHMRQHTGETPYVCEICGKGFKQSTLLHNHSKKVHQKLA
ncbi:hypothetical protein Bbelb_249380 [Branchiostoma belcheri]|nr:hypothetical protein Bbelb_249380 [Branchiostoma belcheri]